MSYQISEKDKQAIRDAAEALYYVSKDKDGNSFIELSADYRDDNKFLLPVAYEHRDDNMLPQVGGDLGDVLLSSLEDTIAEAWFEAIWLAEDKILSKAGFEPNDDMCEPQKEWLRENIPVYPPYSHYLDQSMRVNIMLCSSNEPNHCFSDIYTQYLALAEPDRLTDGSASARKELLDMDTSLKYLVEQQGYTMDKLSETMKDYKQFFYDEDGTVKEHFDENGEKLSLSAEFDLFNKNHSKFLASVCEELKSQTYKEGLITVLAEVSMRDFVEMMKGNSVITMPKDCTCGIFSPNQGAGSVLEVELDKPLVFERKDIYDVQIEGAEPDWGYSLDSVYGLVHSCWKQPSSIENVLSNKELGIPENNISATLDEMLSSAAARAAAQQPQGRGFDEPIR